MKKNVTNNNNEISDKILNELMSDPTRTDREIAKKIGTYRQKVWRKRKDLEKTGVIWGYTPVLDNHRNGRVLYLLLVKMKPMSLELSKLIIKRNLNHKFDAGKVNLINVLYVNGEYDWVIMFSAPDHSTARKYYDSVRLAYDEHLLEKPAIVDVNFSLIREGKKNPRMEGLDQFVP